VGVLLGLSCLVFHVAVAGGIRLRRSDLNAGMAKTVALIYLLDIPAEESLYRGLLFVSSLFLWGLWPAILLSSCLFLGLHLATWRRPGVWAGSAVLSVLCCVAVAWTGSLWTAVLVHTLNNLGFMTLVGRRNVFERPTGELRAVAPAHQLSPPSRASRIPHHKGKGIRSSQKPSGGGED